MKPEDIHYGTAYDHARAIVDAATRSLITGYWAAEGIPLETDPMVAAIAKRMNVGPKMGQRHIPISIIRQAVEDVLESVP